METNENNNLVEGFEGEMLHPSLDVKDGMLILGFRYKSKTGKDEDLILLVRKGVTQILKEGSLIIDNKEYFLERKGRRLIRIDKRWSLSDVNNFLREQANVSKNPIPDGKELFCDIADSLRRYIELEKDIDYTLVAAWIMGTYFHPIFSAYSFLNIKAPKHSGKSQFLRLLQQLCFNAVKAYPTVAALGDTVDSLRGTYLVDQADNLGKKGTEELLNIFTDSYKRGGGKRSIIEFDQNKKRNIVEYETYGPKAFASIRELPEDLLDRCLIIPLMRSKRNFLDPDEDVESWSAQRSRLYKFLIGKYEDIVTDYSVQRIAYKLSGEIVGRSLELWLPFEVMLRCAGNLDAIPEAKKRFLARYNFAEWEPSELERAVVQVILEKFGPNETAIMLSPTEVAELVDYSNVNIFDPKISGHQKSVKVGWLIKKFNIASEKKRSTGNNQYTFERPKVQRIFDSYFPTSPTSDTPNPEKTESLGNVDDAVGP